MAEVSQVDAGISVMLLGSIGFMMALFELTHCYKKSMAKYTWKAVSATISIFSAVLIFQGVNGLVEAYILEGASEIFKLIVNCLHMLAWFTALQWVLALITGVLPVKGFDPKLDDLEVMECRLKTFAILLGHITGFAAINAFGTLQQLVPRTLWCTFLVAPASWGIVFLMGRITDAIRERVVLIGDGKKEKNEEMWDLETEETEDDVIGLAVSFCFVQFLRFAVGNVLPNAEGEDPESLNISHSGRQAFELIAIGCGMAFLESVRIIFISKRIPRITPQFKNIIAMTLSWCVYFGFDWFISGNLFAQEQGMIKQVSLALCVTCVAMCMIFGLDLIEGIDFASYDVSVDQAIRAVVNAIGILIGFAWEKTFDVGVNEIAKSGSLLPAPLTKLVLAVCLASMVVPAWYRHILPTIIAHEKEEETAENTEEEGMEEKENRITNSSSGNLNEPLLRNNSQLEKQKLKVLLLEYEQRATGMEEQIRNMGELERKNHMLEASLEHITQELRELQMMTDVLKV